MGIIVSPRNSGRRGYPTGLGISSARNLHADNLQPPARLLLRLQPGLLVLSLSHWFSHSLSHFAHSQRSCRDARCVCPTHALAHWQVLREDGNGSKPSSPEEDLRLSPAPSHMPKMTQASDSGAGAYPAASGSPRPNRLHKTTQLNIASSDLWSRTSLCTSSSPLLRHPRRVRSIRLHLCSPHANLPQIRRPSEGTAAAGVRSLLVAQWSCGASTCGSTQPGGLAWPFPLVPLVPIQLPTISSSHPPPRRAMHAVYKIRLRSPSPLQLRPQLQLQTLLLYTKGAGNRDPPVAFGPGFFDPLRSCPPAARPPACRVQRPAAGSALTIGVWSAGA